MNKHLLLCCLLCSTGMKLWPFFEISIHPQALVEKLHNTKKKIQEGHRPVRLWRWWYRMNWWLVGGDWNMTFMFPYSGNVIIPFDCIWLLYFSEGFKPPTRWVVLFGFRYSQLLRHSKGSPLYKISTPYGTVLLFWFGEEPSTASDHVFKLFFRLYRYC